MRMGIVGFGRAATFHLDALRLVQAVHIVAACDPEPAEQARAAAAGLEAYASLDAMLDAAQLDAVTICTPPADHAAMAIACLQRGLHVLCEKPLALTTWDALKMLQVANRVQRQLVVASKFRHVPEVELARRMLLSGELGDPMAFEVHFCSPVDMSARWNSQPARAGGGVIIDNGCHAFDIISFLFGSITRVLATPLRPLQQLPVEDSATLQVWAGDNVVGRVDVSWSLPPARDSYVFVHGSRGSVEIGWREARAKINGQPWQTIGGGYDKVEAHRRMHAAFAEAVRTQAAPWISAVECLQAVAAVDAAYRSMRSGASEWVAIHGLRELALVSRSTVPAGEYQATL